MCAQKSGKMFLNCNETFLTSFALDDLLNKLVAGVCEKRPVSSREVLELMAETLESNKMKQWYYDETVRSFNTSVAALHRRGFPLQMTCPLYFRVPLADGGVDELFPSGSQIAVTPNNYSAFELLLKQYYVYRNNADAEGSYYDAVRRFLPVSAQRSLLNASYTPIIKFMLEHLLNPDSPWLVQSAEEWNMLGITYAVPFAGRLFAVEATKSAMLPVPFSEASRYVELASDTCNKLNNLLKTGAPLNAIRQPDTAASMLTAPPAPVEGETARVVALKPSPPPPQHASLPAAAPLARANITAEEMAELESIGLRRETCLQMTPAELSFWDYILRLRRNPSQIHDVSFRLEFGEGRFIDLKANGAFIPVTKHNVEQFIEAAAAKQQEVHRYINEIASTTATTTTTNSSAQTTGVAAAAVAASKRAVPALPPASAGLATPPVPPPMAVAAHAHALVPAPAAAQPSVAGPSDLPAPTRVPTRPRHSPAAGGDSSTWNDIRLRPSDVDSSVIRSMLGLRSLYNENRLTAAELNAENLRFCIPSVEGVYNLIPNGREIKVGLRNFGEFISRVEDEKRRVEAEASSGASPANPPATATLAENEAFWTDRNILEIWTYEVTTELLAKSELPPEEVIQQTGLQWDTHFLRNSDDPQNVMSGPRGEILPGQLRNYLALLHRRLQAIRISILDARKCSKQPSDVESNEAGETEAVPAAAQAPPTAVFFPPHQPRPLPPPPTEADLNMFSPTHNTGGLLAPPQSFNH